MVMKLLSRPKVRLLSNFILVKQDKASEKIGNILLPETQRIPPRTGEVCVAGPGMMLPSGELAPMSVKVGDRIAFAPHRGIDVDLEGEEFLLMSENDIAWVDER